MQLAINKILSWLVETINFLKYNVAFTFTSVTGSTVFVSFIDIIFFMLLFYLIFKFIIFRH